MRWIGLLCCLLTLSAQAGGWVPVHLERGLGPFHLGMTIEAFEHLTGIAPEPCAVCLAEERLATLEGEPLHRLYPAGGEVMDFFFYRGRLYQVTTTPRADLETLSRHLADRFLAPPENLDDDPQLIRLRWRDATTQVILSYDPEIRQVLSINYYDLALLSQREADLAQTTARFRP